MQRVTYTTPVPRMGQSLLSDFADVKLKNKFTELASRPVTPIYKVGTEEGVVEVPFLPGWIYMRAIYPDGSITLEKCYVPTYEDGQTQVLFQPDQIITPRRSSDSQPTFWIYDGVPPTPITKTMTLAEDFDTTGINPAAFDSLGKIVNDSYLPSFIKVDRLRDGSPTELTWTMTDTGKKGSDGQRLWKVKYTGTDFNEDDSDPGSYQINADGSKTYIPPAPKAPVPPRSNYALTKLFDPCNPDKCPPTDPNYPNCTDPADPEDPGIPTGGLPVHNPTLPPIKGRGKVCPQGYKQNDAGDCVKVPDAKPPNKPKTPNDGYRLPPNAPPKTKPPEKPYIPPAPNPNPPGPPTGPGLPPPGPGGGGGDTGGDSGGGTWHDDGEFVDGCFGIPYKLDATVVTSNDTSSATATSASISRIYYDIRGQIDTAIRSLVNDGSYKPKGLISVTLMFDGLGEDSVKTTVGNNAPVENVHTWAVPRVYRTVVTGSTATDQAYYFTGPTNVLNTDAVAFPPKTATIYSPPDLTVESRYRLWSFDQVTIGTDMAPLKCDSLHYTYVLNTVPAYNSELLKLLADHPGYRLYIACFRYRKSETTIRQLGYSHSFSGGLDGWLNTTVVDRGEAGTVGATNGTMTQPGPFQAAGWVSGWNVTVTGWADAAADVFGNITLANGVVGFGAFIGDTEIAHGSKNMFPPLTEYYADKPASYTWTVPNTGGSLFGPCEDYYFRLYGGTVIGNLQIKTVTITPILGATPRPNTAPPPTGPGGNTGGNTGGPTNGGTSPIPAGTPVGPPYNPAAGPGDDGNAQPNQKPANGSATNPSPAVGIAPNDTPSGASVQAQSFGKQGGYSGLTPSLPVYLDASGSGGITQTKPTCSGCLVQELGTALSDTTIDIRIGEATKLL